MPRRKREFFAVAVAAVAALAHAACGAWVERRAPPPPGPTPPGPAAPAAPALVDVADLGPYFADALDGEPARALTEDRLEDARIGFDAIAAGLPADPELAARARFVAAYLASLVGDDARAVAELPALAEELPLVADTAFAAAAASALRLRRNEEAIDLAARVPADGTLGADAAWIRADALRALGRTDAAIAAYRDLLARWPGDDRRLQARASLVGALADLAAAATPPAAAPAEEALALLAALRADAPGDKATREAARREDALLAALGREPEPQKRETNAALEAYEAAAALMRKMKHKEAEKRYGRALKLARDGGDLACRIRSERATVVFRQRDWKRAAPLLEEAAAACRALPGVAVKALYQGGKAFLSADRYEDAIRLFAAVEADFATSSLADDARLYSARCWLALGDRAKFEELAAALPADYPDGDMRAEALWALAFDALERGENERARDALGRYHEEFPAEEGWYAAGRSGYWLGRAEELLGREAEASAAYERVIASAPLTYYMVLAHARLAALDPERAAALLDNLAPAGGAPATRFPKALLDEIPGLAGAIELARLGLLARARREFDRLLADRAAPASAHWIAAALFRRAGELAAAKELTAGGGADWQRRYPAGSDLVYWTLAFPTAFEAEVGAAATESGVDPALLWAIMREESGFAAGAESWANAVGLMQLILPTARSMAKRLQLDRKITGKALRDPAINVRLGAAYLAYLDGEFAGHPALAIAGYNAGEGAVKKWLKAAPGQSLDLFVERIPFAQTRGYTKRVLASFATYKFLYGEERAIVAPPLALD
jgi:soluble lytic murein transglycosylase